MNTYLALLRGINVSGQRMINMKDLKSLFQKEGYENVMTYIQSGNIVFKSNEKDTKKIAKKIAEMIQSHYSFEVPVLVFTTEEVEKVLAKNPFSNDKKDANKFHVTFLDSNPAKENLITIRDEKFQSDEFHIDARTIYLYCPDGYGMTKFSTLFFEKKLGTTATTRNWKTMNALSDLMHGIVAEKK